MKKEMWIVLLVMAIAMYIGSQWDSFTLIKNSVGSVLDPTLGRLLEWNLKIGFAIIIALISLGFTLSHKFLSDQEALKEIKKEQKYLAEEMKKYRDHPEKMMEFQKKQFEILPKTFNLTLKPLIYTMIPVVLLFRWFGDYLHPVFGNWWFLYFMIGSLIFSSIFRKVFKVA